MSQCLGPWLLILLTAVQVPKNADLRRFLPRACRPDVAGWQAGVGLPSCDSCVCFYHPEDWVSTQLWVRL